MITNIRQTLRIAALVTLTATSALTAATTPTRAEADRAETEQVTFDLVIMGLRAGALDFTAAQKGVGYSAVGRLQTSGLAAMLRRVRYDAVVQGRLRNGHYVPTAYREKADTGKRRSASVMEYRKGVPLVQSYDPPRDPRPNDVDPATMGGTVDPLTALFATLRDVNPGEECKVSLQMFDGRRNSKIRTVDPKAKGETVICAGEYRRLAGFSEKEMAEKTHFNFTLTYAPTPEGRMRVIEVAMDTRYGKARLIRR